MVGRARDPVAGRAMPASPVRPGRVVLVAGTGTGVGKTWVGARLLGDLAAGGHVVAARKPAQSFGAGDPLERTDAALLAAATGEQPEEVCPPARWYQLAMAPPMAASVLGRPPFTVADLAAAVAWRRGTDVGLVEAVGGVRSPLAADGDTVDLARALAPDLVVLVAAAGLGAINDVRLAAAALEPVVGDHGGPRRAPSASLVVVLNRYVAADGLHRRNLAWLRDGDGFDALGCPGDLEGLCRRALGA